MERAFDLAVFHAPKGQGHAAMGAPVYQGCGRATGVPEQHHAFIGDDKRHRPVTLQVLGEANNCPDVGEILEQDLFPCKTRQRGAPAT
jgi:hypothetical protein